MIEILKKFTEKLLLQGFTTPKKVSFLACDDRVYSNPESKEAPSVLFDSLLKVFDRMNINSLLYATLNEPYHSIIEELLRLEVDSKGYQCIIPEDCETRTFFHDIPVIESSDTDSVVKALSERKAAIIRQGPAVVSYGTVSPEQAFVSFSSTCFSTFVKYFHDHLYYIAKCRKEKAAPDSWRLKRFEHIRKYISPHVREMAELMKGPPDSEETVLAMITEAGALLVAERLVDSYFGNISAYYKDKIYISETAASLDELSGAIDAVPRDGSSSVGITASSELSTHRAVYQNTGYKFILHGHPKFSVIMSMFCEKDCHLRGRCHKECPEKRYVCGVPVVPGEIGTGPTGIVNTVPQAFFESNTVIVYGHGVFTAGETDFQKPFERIRQIEHSCMKQYFEYIDGRIQPEIADRN